PNVAEDCTTAFHNLAAQAFPGASLDPDTGEIRSGALLTVGFATLDPLEDLCRPSAQQGFLGARNETFRVQVTQPGRFLWGRDNAAPLYRVQVGRDANGNPPRLLFLTTPNDEFGWPLAGMTIELLRWGSKLDNGEKAAEPQGLLLRVAAGYDPDQRSVQLLDDVPQLWDDWFTGPTAQSALNPRDAADRRTYFFARVWSGGGAANAADQPMNVGTPVPLGDTGLTMTFSAPGLTGDFWFVSARPNTPTQVMPAALLDGAPPAGPRRLAAPLALLRWTGPTAPQVVDCRHRFRPLCEVNRCCTITVGDGRNSFGDVTSIQEAVDRLPAEGGEICIHPGEYQEHVVIENRRDIIITGCGARSLWRDRQQAAPLLTIRDCTNVLVRRLAMTAPGVESVLAEDVASPRLRSLEGVVLEDLLIVCAGTAGVRIAGGERHVVRRCRISLEAMRGSLEEDSADGRAAAVFMSGQDLLIEHCRIGTDALVRQRQLLALGSSMRGVRLAVGGLQIGGGSRAVVIRDNIIRGGNGHGITLGSVQYVPEPGRAFDYVPAAGDYTKYTKQNVRKVAAYGRGGLEHVGLRIRADAAGCIRADPVPTDLTGIDVAEPLRPESAGLIRDVRIQRNDIGDMGFSGISACAFTGLGRDGLGDGIAIEKVEISENRIERCMRNEAGRTTPLTRLFSGWGGIALSICNDCTIRDNQIADNGSDSDEAICGIFIATAEDVRIERNLIVRNGIRAEGRALAPGARGGVIIGVALGGVTTFTRLDRTQREADRPAMLVAGNVVDAPNGRALKATLLGPGIVLGNRLTGAGRIAQASPSLAFGFSDLDPQFDLADYAALDRIGGQFGGESVSISGLCVAEDFATFHYALRDGADRLRGGELLFNDNQIGLRWHGDNAQFARSAVALFSADDLSFCNNQVEVENDVPFVLSGVIALAGTLRLTQNRLQERFEGAQFSAVTRAHFNQTAYNQTTHCLYAVGLPQARIVTGNRSVFGVRNSEYCLMWERYAAAESLDADTRWGSQMTTGGHAS
ncbi:MAG TPA: right-handed parallel beta-helix repeat-containing protein, partial [Allosphingosinicella sp.]|nr:right-handed parallel beta-helix repeat-containing protein [Allosphingosinicella sp.]